MYAHAGLENWHAYGLAAWLELLLAGHLLVIG